MGFGDWVATGTPARDPSRVFMLLGRWLRHLLDHKVISQYQLKSCKIKNEAKNSMAS